MVTDADDDQKKEGVDWDPNEGNRKCHDNKADGQGPEDCQEEIQRHQFSWKSKFDLHLIPVRFDFTLRARTHLFQRRPCQRRGDR